MGVTDSERSKQEVDYRVVPMHPYRSTLFIWLGDTLDDVASSGLYLESSEDVYDPDDKSIKNSGACTVPDPNRSHILFKRGGTSCEVVSHEVFHVISHTLFTYRSTPLNEDTEEVWAYLMGKTMQLTVDALRSMGEEI